MRDVTVYIDTEERYPTCSMVDQRFGEPVTVDSATVERWGKVAAAFDAVQLEMAQALRKARSRPASP